MKKLLVILIVLISTSIYASDNKRKLAEELIELSNADATIDAIYDQMGQVSSSMASQMGIKPEDKENFDKYMNKVSALMKAEMNWDKMEGPIKEIYLKHYTEKELEDLVTFYKSETGQAMVKKMPNVIQDTMLLTQSMMKEFFPKMQALSAEFAKELKASKSN